MASELEPTYLITGSDEPKVALAVKRLRARFASEAIEELTGEAGPDAASGGDVVASLNALGLFGEGERLVIVRGMGAWKKDDVDAISSYLQQPAPQAVLALVGTAPRAGDLAKACKSAGEVLRFDVPTRARGRRLDYPAWVRTQFERHGMSIDAASAQRLVELVGDDATALENEVAKLATWAGGDAIGTHEIERLVAQSHEASAFALTDSWGAGNRSGALGAAFASVEESGEEPFLQALRVAGQASKVRGARRILDAGGTARDIASELGLKDYPARKAAQFAENYTAAELDRATIRLARLDFDLKGGTPLSGALQLERAILEITGSRERD
ncbi:MAG: DNA polymerase III subunit delta [Gaiellaceae bacterium]